MDLSNDHGAAPERTLEMLGQPSPAHRQRVNEAASLSALWTELVSGTCKVEAAVFSEETCALVVTRPALAAQGPALSKRHAQVLERALVEGARKSVAMDLGLCPSSVAEILKQGFSFMGLSCWPSRMPLLLVLAAQAQRARELDRAAAELVRENAELARQTISVTRPDSELSALLTPAEYAVTRLLIEGKSYAEMARLRRTSVRTVANQVAATFHRLGVSGRAELLCLLAARKVAAWRISTPISPFSSSAVDAAQRFLRVASCAGA